MSRLARFFDEERDARVLGVLRVSVGALVVVQAGARLLELFDEGYFGDFFHLPMVPEAMVPSMPVYLLLQLVSIAGGILAILGPYGRGGLLVSALIGVFLLLANRLDYHNNRFALLLLAFLTAFSPCDRNLLVFPRGARARQEAERLAPRLGPNLIRLTVSAVYLSSGGGKLFDPDWRGGQTMLIRFNRAVEHLTERWGALPDAFVAVYTSPAFASLASKAAITLELALAVGLWLPRLRPVALYAGALFHLGVELTARVELFSYVMAAAYIAFAAPSLRERTVELDARTPLGKGVARLLPLVDWLARFHTEVRPGTRFAVVDRGGERHFGLGALTALTRATPLLFPFWGPLAVISAVRRRPAQRPARG